MNKKYDVLFYVYPNHVDLKWKERCSRHCSVSWLKSNTYQIYSLWILFLLVDHISPGGPLVVLKEAVDNAEEEGKAWKTAT